MKLCEKVKCPNPVDVCLNGVLWLCWDHYVEEIQRREEQERENREHR